MIDEGFNARFLLEERTSESTVSKKMTAYRISDY